MLRWHLDLASDSRKTSVVDPPGFITSSNDKSKSKQVTHSATTDDEIQNRLKMKLAWDTALAPGKTIPMQMFMLWMSGNSVQIFSIMITGMLLWNGIKGIMGTNQLFERFAIKKTTDQDPLLLPKLVHVAMQFALILLGLYKMGTMGLLPNSQSDWLAWKSPKHILEFSAGGNDLQ